MLIASNLLGPGFRVIADRAQRLLTCYSVPEFSNAPSTAATTVGAQTISLLGGEPRKSYRVLRGNHEG